jgi:hypothetical protein
MNNLEFSRDINLLKENLCWVIFRFPDNSVKMIKTTLREDLLEGLEVEKDSLYDFLTYSWLNLSKLGGSKIEIYLKEPILREVDLFANKFIR